MQANQDVNQDNHHGPPAAAPSTDDPSDWDNHLPEEYDATEDEAEELRQCKVVAKPSLQPYSKNLSKCRGHKLPKSTYLGARPMRKEPSSGPLTKGEIFVQVYTKRTNQTNDANKRIDTTTFPSTADGTVVIDTHHELRSKPEINAFAGKRCPEFTMIDLEETKKRDDAILRGQEAAENDRKNAIAAHQATADSRYQKTLDDVTKSQEKQLQQILQQKEAEANQSIKSFLTKERANIEQSFASTLENKVTEATEKRDKYIRNAKFVCEGYLNMAVAEGKSKADTMHHQLKQVVDSQLEKATGTAEKTTEKKRHQEALEFIDLQKERRYHDVETTAKETYEKQLVSARAKAKTDFDRTVKKAQEETKKEMDASLAKAEEDAQKRLEAELQNNRATAEAQRDKAIQDATTDAQDTRREFMAQKKDLVRTAYIQQVNKARWEAEKTFKRSVLNRKMKADDAAWRLIRERRQKGEAKAQKKKQETAEKNAGAKRKRNNSESGGHQKKSRTNPSDGNDE